MEPRAWMIRLERFPALPSPRPINPTEALPHMSRLGSRLEDSILRTGRPQHEPLAYWLSAHPQLAVNWLVHQEDMATHWAAWRHLTGRRLLHIVSTLRDIVPAEKFPRRTLRRETSWPCQLSSLRVSTTSIFLRRDGDVAHAGFGEIVGRGAGCSATQHQNVTKP